MRNALIYRRLALWRIEAEIGEGSGNVWGLCTVRWRRISRRLGVGLEIGLGVYLRVLGSKYSTLLLSLLSILQEGVIDTHRCEDREAQVKLMGTSSIDALL